MIDTLTLNVAVFVKTPALSPLKTRLAAGIGAAASLEFYDLACKAVAAVLRDAKARGMPPVAPHWAVAEAAGASAWAEFPVVAQGEGGLGDRLDRVYAQLAGPRAAAVLIGADAPQIGLEAFAAAHAALTGGSDFVLGPAADGGFYLFAGRRPIPAAVWTSVVYSSTTTAARLEDALAPLGKVTRLVPLTDADEVRDLPHVERELRARRARNPEQDALLAWLAKRAQ